MELIADILMICGTLSVAIYCMVLSRRLRSFTNLEKGMGGAIAVLSVQVDDMTKTLTIAQKSASGSAVRLQDLNQKSEQTAKRLELLIASMHDLPDVAPPPMAQAAAPAHVAPRVDDPVTQSGDDSGQVVSEAFFSSRRARMEAAE